MIHHHTDRTGSSFTREVPAHVVVTLVRRDETGDSQFKSEIPYAQRPATKGLAWASYWSRLYPLALNST
jgi:hypothetical protein